MNQAAYSMKLDIVKETVLITIINGSISVPKCDAIARKQFPSKKVRVLAANKPEAGKHVRAYTVVPA